MPFKKSSLDRDVHEVALERMRVVFDRYDLVSVMFSGGKDSTVCLNLALEVARERKRLPLDVVFWDEEAIPPETIDYVERVRREVEGVSLRWLCVPVQHRNACSRTEPYWFPWAPEDRERWCRPLPEGAITELKGATREPISALEHLLYPDVEGTVGVVLGIRASESLRRQRLVTKRVEDNWIHPNQYDSRIFKCKPIYDWNTSDVWTAPAKFGWDYNRSYDVMELAGISRHVQRVCPPFGEEPLQKLWMYGECWPDLWEKMLLRVDGAASAGRYSRSPLYGFNARSKPDLVAGETWQDLIREAISRWPRDMQPKIAARISREIQSHNARTNGAPIPDENPSRSTISWDMLLMIATRGDTKGRKGVVLDPNMLTEEGPR